MTISIAEAFVTLRPDLSRFEGEAGAAISKSLDGFARTSTKAGLALSAGLTAPIAAIGLTALKASIDFESAFAGVRKTVDATEAEFGVLEKGIRDMAKELPASAVEIAGVAEAAGQLGVQKESILGFTRVMVDLGETTNLTADQAATDLARLANITQMPQDAFDRLGATVVALGNAGASTESDIVSMGLRIAGAGSQIGLTEAQILGFANALSSVGIEAEAGGSSVSRVMIDIANSVASADDKLETFAAVAGLSVAEFSRLFREDAAGAVVAFIEGLGRISSEGGNVFATLESLELGEIRVRDALLRASGAGDLFRESITLGTEAWKENTALTDEASKRYETTAAKLEVLKNRFTDSAITLGDALVPALISALDAAEPLFGMVEFGAEMFAALPAPVQTAVVALAALVAVIGPMLLLIGGMASGISALVPLLGALSVGMRTMGASAGVAVGPVGILLGSIVALEVASRTLTGVSLTDRLFGDVARIKASERALREWNAQLLAAGPGADRAAIAFDRFDEINAETAAGLEETRGGLTGFVDNLNHQVFGAMDKATLGLLEWQTETEKARLTTKGYQEEVKLLAQELVTAQTPVLELARVYNDLDPALQGAFDSVTNITAAMATQEFAMASAAQATDGWRGSLAAVAPDVEATAGAIDKVGHSAFEVAQFLGGQWGVTLLTVMGTTNAEAREGLEQLAAKFPEVGLGAEDLAEYLEVTFGPAARKEFEKLVESAEENFEGVRDAIESILPSTEETFAQWKARLEEMVEDNLAFETNLKTIYGAITDAGVAMPVEILAALAEKGPAFVAHFTKLFSEDPQGALGALKLVAPALMGETADAIVARIIGAEPGVSTAVELYINKPFKDALAAGTATAEQAAIAQHEAAITALMGDGTEAHAAGVGLGNNFSLGLTAGVQFGIPSIAAASQQAVNAMVSAATSGLQIGSPSKVAADEIGLPFTQGIAEGMVSPEALAYIDRATGLLTEAGMLALYGFIPEAEVAGSEAAKAFGDGLSGTDALQYIDRATGLLTEAGMLALYGFIPDAAEAGAAAGAAAGQAFSAALVGSITNVFAGNIGAPATPNAKTPGGVTFGSGQAGLAAATAAGINLDSPKPGDPMSRTWREWIMGNAFSGTSGLSDWEIGDTFTPIGNQNLPALPAGMGWAHGGPTGGWSVVPAGMTWDHWDSNGPYVDGGGAWRLIPGIPSFRVGTPLVPDDMLAWLHKGEAVIPAHENRPGMANAIVQPRYEAAVTVNFEGYNPNAGDLVFFLRTELRREMSRWWAEQGYAEAADRARRETASRGRWAH